MADQQSTSESSLKRWDTMATDDSSGQSMQDVQPSSSTNSPSSTAPKASDSVSSSAQSKRGASSGTTARKRKVPDSVTPNACNNCKKARAKCDGVKPACNRCVNRNLRNSCVYEIHAKTAKEQMIREIQRLQRKNENLEEEKDTLGEKNSWIEQIIRSLKENCHGPEIISRLKRGESHRQIAEWLGRPLITTGGVAVDPHTLSPDTERNITEAIHQYHRRMVEEHDPRYWTNVTPEASFIEHLVNLYLTWIHPAHMLFDEGRFMSSFRECSDTYCSSAMVNAICAMSCCLLHDEIGDNSEQTAAGIAVIRDKFMEETRSLMRNAEFGKMTAIQTYAVMFLVELSSGRALIGSSHLRLAAESLLSKHTSEQSSESEEIAAWGILTLYTAWSGFTYQKPSAPISTSATPFSNIDLQQGQDLWRHYKQLGDPNVEQRPSYSGLTASEYARLGRIIHETILVYCGSHGRVSARALLDLYERYVDWKEHLPSDLRLQEAEPLPHVLFLHIQYYVALIHLLQPLLQQNHFYQESYENLRSLLVKNAKRGLELQDQYSRLYTSHYLSPIQLFCLVHLGDCIIRLDTADNASRNECIQFCIISLEQAKIGYTVAGPLQKMFHAALSDYDIPISRELERHIGSSIRIGPEELLEACTRLTYQQPIAQLLPNMAPRLGQEFIEGYQQKFQSRPSEQATAEASNRGRGNQKWLEIGALLNR